MSKTYRQVPCNRTGLRKPRTRNERRQLNCLKADARFCDLDISPRNRINRHIPTDYDDLHASSVYEMDYGIE